MNTNIGNVDLTENQILNWVPFSIWKKFSYIEGEVIGRSDVNPSASDIQELKDSLSALSNAPQPISAQESDKTDFATSPFFGITPDQADAWIQSNVTDLASAKVALKRIVKVLIYLVRRSNLK